jgi:hypothetical protein
MMLAAPAGLRDVLAVYGLSRGIPFAPSKDKAAAIGNTQGHPTAMVKVYGGSGQVTPAIQKAADQFHVRGMAGDWSKRTGSTPEAISFWTSE